MWTVHYSRWRCAPVWLANRDDRRRNQPHHLITFAAVPCAVSAQVLYTLFLTLEIRTSTIWFFWTLTFTVYEHVRESQVGSDSCKPRHGLLPHLVPNVPEHNWTLGWATPTSRPRPQCEHLAKIFQPEAIKLLFRLTKPFSATFSLMKQ